MIKFKNILIILNKGKEKNKLILIKLGDKTN